MAFVGEDKRVSAGTRSWKEADRVARRLAGDSAVQAKTISEAVNLFIEDQRQQNHSKNWVHKHTRELTHFAEYCASENIHLISKITLHDLEGFRKTWPGAAITRSKRQERLRQFFRYCVKHRWCSENLAADLSKIKVEPSETLPLTCEQFAAALKATNTYHPRGRDPEWRRQRAEAMLLLCRHSGLRISDAARLERSKLLANDALFLRTTKTGQHVYVPLPKHVARRLRQLKNDNSQYFFWNGTSARETPGIRWWNTLKTIFKAAGIPESHPHCLRDTFAVECLIGGIDIKKVSVMLGHSSVAITERHLFALGVGTPNGFRGGLAPYVGTECQEILVAKCRYSSHETAHFIVRDRDG
jgi:site-specific recombinase XerD